MAMLVITRGYLSTPVPRCTPCWIFSWWNHFNFLGIFLWWSYSHCPFWIMLNPQFSRLWLSSRLPIGSMYAIYGNIYHQYTPNVSIYTIHGSYGLWWSWVFPCFATFAGEFCRFFCPIFWWRHHTWFCPRPSKRRAHRHGGWDFRYTTRLVFNTVGWWLVVGGLELFLFSISYMG